MFQLLLDTSESTTRNMATAVYIQIYESTSDRGAFVQKIPCSRREIDEREIHAGGKLPWWEAYNAPVVKAYDGHQLDFECDGKTFCIKEGDEVLVRETIMSQEYGVTTFSLYTVKVVSTEFVYKGGWQHESTIRQKLEGPIGNGKVWRPNGDHFKGYFHLSFAHINGPAHAAEGRYTFADGSFIEHAWINTSSDYKTFDLHGVFRIHHPKGPDSIAMFCKGGRRYGFELILDPSKPRVKEWWANEEIIRWERPNEIRELEVVDYAIDETSKKDCLTLKLSVRDGNNLYRTEQQGGRYVPNRYDSYYYAPYTHDVLWLPNGDILESYGSGVREFQPYDGYVEVHCASTLKCRTEYWEKGKLMDDQNWKRDKTFANEVVLPNPIGGDDKLFALVWKDNHIDYSHGEWTYDGEMKDDRPEGQGILVGDRSHNGRRYEGTFRCGQYVDPEACSSTIRLHATSGSQSWSIGGKGDWEYEESDIIAQVGRLSFGGFKGYEIVSITSDCITISRYDGEEYQLKRGGDLRLHESIDGHEYSDGCVYDGTYYSLVLTWPE